MFLSHIDVLSLSHSLPTLLPSLSISLSPPSLCLSLSLSLKSIKTYPRVRVRDKNVPSQPGVGRGPKMNRDISKDSHELAHSVKILLLFIGQENYRIRDAENPHILTCVISFKFKRCC